MLKKCLSIDGKNIFRDDTLVSFLFVPVVVAIALRFLKNDLVEELSKHNINVCNMNQILTAFFLIIMPTAILGYVYGFIFIEERDKRVVTVLKILPIKYTTIIKSRLLLGTVIGAILVAICVCLGKVYVPSISHLCILSFLSSVNVSIFCFIIAGFSKNKVEGLATTKYLYALYLVPFITSFIKLRFEAVFGIIPTYWIIKAVEYCYYGDSRVWICYVIGVLYNSLVVWVLYKIFTQKTDAYF